MSCKGFICPKATIGNITFAECVEKCNNRCISKRSAAVFEAQSSRKPDGKTATQLIQPTRLQWFIMTRDWYEPPGSFVARTIGSLGHSKTDIELEDALTEERLLCKIGDVELSGMADSLEDDVLWDLKICGVFKIKRGLLDIRELHDWTLQLNFYRYLYEKVLQLPVKKMCIEAWAKEPDGLLRKDNIQRCTVFTIPKLSDWLIEKYFTIKYRLLQLCLETGTAPKCEPRERWRCKMCPFNELCRTLPTEGRKEWLGGKEKSGVIV